MISARPRLKTLLPVLFVILASCGFALSASAQRLRETPGLETATFAGGCFWCVEADFDKIDGVVATTSGYIGGTTPNPTYRQVAAGGTGHAEAVEIKYDPAKVSFTQLVTYFWRTIDPLDNDGQFCDRGDVYRSAIFFHSDEQRKIAEATRDQIVASKRFRQPIVTEITPATKFTVAEDYHQDYYRKNAGRYASYRAGCGRDARIKGLWGDEAFSMNVPVR
ncbi:MAG TPA: peptide-methionine (S)-S-oxide reductase MsrA [Hyphomicrobiaceae bacterium]|nr:peptide-methionine (S)-S-oxide reductase MsrA [Hyphomicrobiaceae bacterium]